nr:DUF3052 domain-containing protein [Psychromicrobium silvestre]
MKHILQKGSGDTVSEAEADTSANVAVRLGFKEGELIQEFGYDEDVDFDLRADIEDLIGSELLEEDDHEVADAILLWHRADDGDLVDALMDALTGLDDGGVVWVLSPKSGRDGYLAPAEIQEAAPTAGLHVTSSVGVSEDWAATRLVPRRNK